MSKYPERRVSPVVFAIVKEDLRLDHSYEEIAAEMGLTEEEVEEIDHTKYFKLYQTNQDEREYQRIIEEEARKAGLQ